MSSLVPARRAISVIERCGWPERNPRHGSGELGVGCEKCTPILGKEERKKHHYIPVFYLQQWVRREDGKLCEFSRPYKTPPGQPEPSIKSIPVKPSGCTLTLRVLSTPVES